MHVETSPLEDWLVIVALHRLAADYDDVDPDLASRAYWLAVAIDEACNPSCNDTGRRYENA